MDKPCKVYSKQNIELWHGDSELFNYPSDIDLLLADPPYGKTFKSNFNSKSESIVGDRDQEKINRIILNIWKKIRPSRHAYVFGPARNIPYAAVEELIWNKKYTSLGNLRNTWGRSHEQLYFYAHRYKSEAEGHRQNRLSARLRRSSVITMASPRGSMSRYHPNEKPVRLVQQLVEASSIVGDLVIDPFCGSGSSAIACLLLGRRYIGIDCDRNYLNRAIDRLQGIIVP